MIIKPINNQALYLTFLAIVSCYLVGDMNIESPQEYLSCFVFDFKKNNLALYLTFFFCNFCMKKSTR